MKIEEAASVHGEGDVRERLEEDDDKPETICYAKRSRRRVPWLAIVLYTQGGVRAGRGGDLWFVVLPVPGNSM
jgi:hypothetical protein